MAILQQSSRKYDNRAKAILKTNCMNSKSEHAFVAAGLLSALLTLVLGAFWLIFFVLGTGVIFSTALFTTESLL